MCVQNTLAWMFCKIDGINYYCYQHDGELCKGKVMGWGWAFQWDPPCVTPTWSGWNLDSFGYCRSVVEIYVDKGFTLGTPWVVKRMLSSS